MGFALSANGNETQDFALSIDFAKKISMMARTEMGEKVREYFLKIERRYIEDHKMFTIWEYCRNHRIAISMNETSKKSIIAKELAKEMSQSISLIPHPKYGFIHAYPAWILKKVFEI